MSEQTPTERALVVLLDLSGSILGRTGLRPTDQFLKLGGNSIQLLRLVTRMQRDHDLHVDVRRLMEAPSFTDLATHCTFGLGDAR
jgi:aryl carrier-like protein